MQQGNSNYRTGVCKCRGAVGVGRKSELGLAFGLVDLSVGSCVHHSGPAAFCDQRVDLFAIADVEYRPACSLYDQTNFRERVRNAPATCPEWPTTRIRALIIGREMRLAQELCPGARLHTHRSEVVPTMTGWNRYHETVCRKLESKAMARTPAELLRDFACINGIAKVVPRTIRYLAYEPRIRLPAPAWR